MLQPLRFAAVVSLLLPAALAQANAGSNPIFYCEPTELANYPADAHAQISSSEQGLVLSLVNNMYGFHDTVIFRAVESKDAGKSVYTATAMLNARPGANPAWVRNSVATLRLEVASGGNRASLNFYDTDGALNGLKMTCATGADPNQNYEPSGQ